MTPRNELYARMVESILDYIVEEGGPEKLTTVDALGILEMCKLTMVRGD